MKRTRLTRLLSVFLMLVMAAGVLAACGGQDEEPESRKKGLADEIVGTWVNEENAEEYEDIRIRFLPSGKYELKVSFQGHVTESRGSYEVEEDKTLSLNVDRGDSSGETASIAFEYSKEHAGREGYWYLYGETLYLEGAELHRK